MAPAGRRREMVQPPILDYIDLGPKPARAPWSRGHVPLDHPYFPPSPATSRPLPPPPPYYPHQPPPPYYPRQPPRAPPAPAIATTAEERGEYAGQTRGERGGNNAAATKTGAGRFDWVWVPLVALTVVGVSLAFVFAVAIPHCVRNRIEGHSFGALLSSHIEAVSPTEVRLGVATQVLGPASLTVRLDPFELRLSNVDRNDDDPHPPFAALAMPALTVNGPTDWVVAPQTVGVQNASELSVFLTHALTGYGATLRLQGATNARVGAVNTWVTIDREILFGGLNSLSGTNVTETKAVAPFVQDSANIEGHLMISNMSPFTLSLGNVTCGIYGIPGHRIPDELIGNSTVKDLVIRPGRQEVAWRGQLDVATTLGYVKELPAGAEALQVAVRGNKTVVDGQQIHYLDELLRRIDFLTDVPRDVGVKGSHGGPEHLQI